MMHNSFRHEYKYIISQSSAELLKRRLPCMMARDPHAGPAGQYIVRSLYFDDPNFSAFDEKMNGLRDREKFRLRCYNYDMSSVRLEKKEKRGDLTRKTGQLLTTSEVEALRNGQWGDISKTSGDLLGELRRKTACGFRPAVIVDYDRTAFVCNAGQIRITLDENVRTKPYEKNLWSANTAMIPVLDPGEVVLEVKFNDFLPGFLKLEDIPKINLAISKYVLCANKI